jgi:hypothetical protein
MSRRSAVELTSEEYVRDHFDNMLGCPQCYSEKWLAAYVDNGTLFVDATAVFHRASSEIVKDPHRCGK